MTFPVGTKAPIGVKSLEEILLLLISYMPLNSEVIIMFYAATPYKLVFTSVSWLEFYPTVP